MSAPLLILSLIPYLYCVSLIQTFIQPSKSLVLYDASGFVINSCSDAVMPVVKFISNFSLSQGNFYTLWKIGYFFFAFSERKEIFP